MIPLAWSEIPYWSEQGIFFTEQGIRHKQTGKA
jgi:hypothetical protein